MSLPLSPQIFQSPSSTNVPCPRTLRVEDLHRHQLKTYQGWLVDFSITDNFFPSHYQLCHISDISKAKANKSKIIQSGGSSTLNILALRTPSRL